MRTSNTVSSLCVAEKICRLFQDINHSCSDPGFFEKKRALAYQEKAITKANAADVHDSHLNADEPRLLSGTITAFG